MSGPIEGLDELIEELRNLPTALAGESAAIIEHTARASFNQITANYLQHQVTGKLADHLKIDTLRTEFGTFATITNTSKIAYIFENGSVARHYITKKNGVRHVTGSMPAINAFIPVVSRNRLRMYDELRDLLIRHGLEVSDAAA